MANSRSSPAPPQPVHMTAAILLVGFGDTHAFKFQLFAAGPGQSFLYAGFQCLFVGFGYHLPSPV